MKNFINLNLANMTFIYSMIVLLNASTSVLFTDSKLLSSIDLIAIAILVLGMFMIGYFVSTIDFKSTFQFHSVNISLQLIILIIFLISFSSEPIAFSSILGNVFIFVVLYYSVYKIQKNKMTRLAEEINRRLAYKKS
ncbi:hypothetical protein AAK938_05160 [Aerococcaceae bacterium 50-4]